MKRDTTSNDTHSPGRHGGPDGAKLLVIPALAAAILALFAWPQAELEPRGLPIGLAGPDLATAPLEQRMAENPEAIDVHRYDDGTEARRAIEDREVYGAFVATPAGPELLTASAASPAVSAMLTELAVEAGEESGAEIPVSDVVAADPDDPRGAAFGASVLPLLIAGLVTGVVCATGFARGPRQIGALLAASALAGLAAITVTQGWLGVIEGPWLVNAGVLSLLVLSVAAIVAGCVAWLGLPGIGLAAILVVLIGNPWSGIATAPELLPEPTGLIGQLLPPGAAGNALRSTAFFDGAAAWGHLAILFGWATVGVAAILAANGLGRSVLPAVGHSRTEPRVA
jgi:hypothetical protein